MTDIITYDQPLNEVIRLCLRLEQIFEQLQHQTLDLSMLGSRHIIGLIINLLQLLDRPDLKAKLAKELSQLLTSLMRYGHSPNIDANKLNDLTQQIEQAYQRLITSNGKIGQRLRELELLNALRLQIATPGSGCSFDTPVYHYWLSQPEAKRRETITDWLSDFQEIRSIVKLILNLVRQNAKTENRVAVHGFYQELLDPQSSLRMIRLSVNKAHAAFPEMSIGRHFLSVRFHIPDIKQRPAQFTEDLPFSIAYCNA